MKYLKRANLAWAVPLYLFLLLVDEAAWFVFTFTNRGSQALFRFLDTTFEE